MSGASGCGYWVGSLGGGYFYVNKVFLGLVHSMMQALT